MGGAHWKVRTSKSECIRSTPYSDLGSCYLLLPYQSRQQHSYLIAHDAVDLRCMVDHINRSILRTRSNSLWILVARIYSNLKAYHAKADVSLSLTTSSDNITQHNIDDNYCPCFLNDSCYCHFHFSQMAFFAICHQSNLIGCAELLEEFNERHTD